MVHTIRILCLLMLAVCHSCKTNGPTPGDPNRPVEILPPDNVFSLFDEVTAFRTADGNEASQVELPLGRLRERVGTFTDVLLAEYRRGVIEEIKFEWKERNILAELRPGTTYIVWVRPTGRIADIYHVLCKFDRLRGLVDRAQPGIFDRICPFILCSPDLHRGGEIFDRFPEIVDLRTQFDIEQREIGGFGQNMPMNVCDRCTSLRVPGHLYPDPACWHEPPAPAPSAFLVNMIPASLSNETNQDSEPFLAVHPNNLAIMAGSAFTPDPNGSLTNAPIYLTTDGGTTWTLCSNVPSRTITGDISHAMAGATGDLYTGIIRRPVVAGNLLVDLLTAVNIAGCPPMNVSSTYTQADQPFVQASTVGSNNRIYVGFNHFLAPGGRTASIAYSTNSGATYQVARIEARTTSGQNGPSIRPTVAADGTVYAAFFGWRSFVGGIATSDVVVVRDDNGGMVPNPFADLADPSDAQPGRIVVSARSIPWSNAPTLGQERIGSTLSIAVNPQNSAEVYVAWGDRVGSDIYTLHLRRSTDRGATWSGDLRTVSNATCCSLAVSNSGTVGFLYQQVVNVGGTDRWLTMLEISTNRFDGIARAVTLATVAANVPALAFLPYIGDYNFLLAVGDSFRGIFSTNNTPDMANFPHGCFYQRNVDLPSKTLRDDTGTNVVPPSIDPIYFRVPIN